MKETIYTIPVNEGFDEGGECPFCNMYHKLEAESIDFMLGASYMEDDIRMETNKIGFCHKHNEMMYKAQNRLGVALMADTHLQQVITDLEALIPQLSSDKPKGIFSRAKKSENPVSPYLSNITNSCYVCNKINKNFDRYFDTFFYMWKSDNDIKQRVKDSDGFCLEHFGQLLTAAEKNLSAKEYNNFIEIVVPLELENLKRLEKEVAFFINKFDHRYKDVPWGDSKDALIRAMLKIASLKVED
jgi:hypothetical protein